MLEYDGSVIDKLRKIPKLSIQEEEVLIGKYQKENDIEARNKIITNYVLLIWDIANKFKNCRRVQIMDLFHEGIFGLIKALDRFDLSKKFRFSTYATDWVFCNMKRHIQSFDGAVAKSEYSFSKNKKEGVISPVDVSLNDPLPGGDEPIDLLKDPGIDLERSYMIKDELAFKKKIVSYGMSFLTEREREIIKCRFFDENFKSYEVIGKELNMSKEGAKQIVVRALNKIKKAIKNKHGVKDNF
ncbi:MAG: sigma-70 family RNA polymerase sigma factor [Magnetococcus sp. YQC-3]